jgi:acyl carrier protein
MELEADLGIDSIKRVEILSMVNQSLGGIFTKEHVEELSTMSRIADMVEYLNTVGTSETSPEVPAPAAEAKAETAPEPERKETATGTDGKLNEIILAAIADKTGYPEDMIEGDMELEADLGIDSIKRVEIFADVVRKLSITLTPAETEELSTMSTVEEIAAYLSGLV